MSEAELQALYTNPSYVGGRFKVEAKKLGFKPKQIDDFIKSQESAQINKQKVGAVDYYPIWGRGKGSYQADLMFYPSFHSKTKLLPVLCVINVNTRMAYCYLLKTKGALEVALGLRKFIHDCGTSRNSFLQTDNGSEFLNKDVQILLKENEIEHETVEPGDHTGQAMVERFNGSIKALLKLYTDATDLPWMDVLHQIVDNYNHRVNREMGVAPIDATETQNMRGRELQYEKAKEQMNKFSVGDTVRKKIIKRQGFDKGRTEYSHTLYTITLRDHNHFILSDGSRAMYYNLQKVGAVVKAPSRVNKDEERVVVRKEKKVVRDLAKEGIDKHKEAVVEPLIGTKLRKNGHMGEVVSYKRSLRGDPTLNSDWTVLWDDKSTETMNLGEIEKYRIKTDYM